MPRAHPLAPSFLEGEGQRQIQNRVPKIPEVHVDYCFLGSAADTRPRCILVAKQLETKYLLASVVPLEGASHKFQAKRIGAPRRRVHE